MGSDRLEYQKAAIFQTNKRPGLINKQKRPLVTAFKIKQRCLIPANGFYEWKGKKGNKLPYHIIPVGHPFFTFAVFYDIWINEDGNHVYTFTIITTKASDKMEQLHHRMPAILLSEEFDLWLDQTNELESEDIRKLLTPFPDDGFDFYPVSKYPPDQIPLSGDG